MKHRCAFDGCPGEGDDLKPIQVRGLGVEVTAYVCDLHYERLTADATHGLSITSEGIAEVTDP